MLAKGTTKKCNACRAVLPVGDFTRDRSAGDGLERRCKACKRMRFSAYYAANKVKVLASNARWRKGKHGKMAALQAGYRERHPRRIRARIAVNRAIRNGNLAPAPCRKCGLVPKKINGRQRIQAHHHHGYDRGHWLDIVWLCLGCHKIADKVARS